MSVDLIDYPGIYYALFNRIPDEIIRRLRDRNISDCDLVHESTCYVGWAVREEISRIKKVPVEQILPFTEYMPVDWIKLPDISYTEYASSLFGGTALDWNILYHHSSSDHRYSGLVRAAFYHRVNQLEPLPPLRSMGTKIKQFLMEQLS